MRAFNASILACLFAEISQSSCVARKSTPRDGPRSDELKSMQLPEASRSGEGEVSSRAQRPELRDAGAVRDPPTVVRSSTGSSRRPRAAAPPPPPAALPQSGEVIGTFQLEEAI